MTKAKMLEIIKLLSALESWSFICKERLPEHHLMKLDEIMAELTEKVLK